MAEQQIISTARSGYTNCLCLLNTLIGKLCALICFVENIEAIYVRTRAPIPIWMWTLQQHWQQNYYTIIHALNRRKKCMETLAREMEVPLLRTFSAAKSFESSLLHMLSACGVCRCIEALNFCNAVSWGFVVGFSRENAVFRSSLFSFRCIPDNFLDTFAIRPTSLQMQKNTRPINVKSTITHRP